MDPFIPNFQSALQPVINSSTILETHLKETCSKTCSDAQNTLLRYSQDLDPDVVLLPEASEGGAAGSPVVPRRRPHRGKLFIRCWKTFRVWERPQKWHLKLA